MFKKRNDIEPFYYPDYIVEALRRLGQASCSCQYPLLNRRIDIIQILFNQLEDYPITDQIYSYVWYLLNNMVSNGHDEWVKEYWSYACQYYLFTKKFAVNADEKQKNDFLEFHLMTGVMLVYMKRYNLLRHFMTYTSSLPAQYPLVPNTYCDIIRWYKLLSQKNEDTLYLLKYSMKGMNDGALQERKVEGLLLDYIALLMIRLHSVDDYNITYSDPKAFPSMGNTFEEAERNILIADVIKKRVEKWQQDKKALEELGFDDNNLELGKDLLTKYANACRDTQQQLLNHADISEQKRESLKNDMLDALKQRVNRVPSNKGHDNEYTVVTKYRTEQSVALDDRLILTGREPISNNLGEALVSALYTEIRMNYCYQFLLHGTSASFAIPYRDVEKALNRLELDMDYTILAMGVSPHFFDEIEGFTRKDDGGIEYKGIMVIEIASNENSFIIMKSCEMPTVSLRPLQAEENPEPLEEINGDYHLYSNINRLEADRLILKARMGYLLHIVEPMKYVRLRIAYQLDSDNVVLNRVLPIKNYMV